MDIKQIGIWSFMLGIILALAAAFFNLGGWVTHALIILGILVGVFHPIRKEFITLGIAYLAISAAAASMNGLFAVGPFITLIAQTVAGFLGPVVLTAFLLWGFPYLITLEKSKT